MAKLRETEILGSLTVDNTEKNIIKGPTEVQSTIEFQEATKPQHDIISSNTSKFATEVVENLFVKNLVVDNNIKKEYKKHEDINFGNGAYIRPEKTVQKNINIIITKEKAIGVGGSHGFEVELTANVIADSVYSIPLYFTYEEKRMSILVDFQTDSNIVNVIIPFSNITAISLSEDADVKNKNFHVFSRNPNAVEINGSLVSAEGGNLGSESKRWNNAFFETAPIIASDSNFKEDVEELSEDYSNLFDAFRPVSFKLKSGSSDRRHIGLLADDVKDSLNELNIDTKDFAGYCSWMEKGKTRSGIRYEEIIALCVKEIQELKKEINELKNK